MQQSNRIYVRPEGTLNRLLRMIDIYMNAERIYGPYIIRHGAYLLCRFARQAHVAQVALVTQRLGDAIDIVDGAVLKGAQVRLSERSTNGRRRGLSKYL